ncbi:uncharacterized protein LOC130635786 [Hydractinia symbiolongicarpus]|uniref:uncharacterized protein LOC130635786 n=1 Tax=Hydractinia symbiolongicarpus TaxID=13093 RepID=UPI00254FBBBC|nr:uncharacterized protein LOC130635786 [Hydractinia symbiolongicarpus]
MCENLFTSSTAWFSTSVSSNTKNKWEQHGGKVVKSTKDANFLFSDDSTSEDTKRAFLTIHHDVVIFKSTWIEQAILISQASDNAANKSPCVTGIEKFVLMPESVQKEWDIYTNEERYKEFLKNQKMNMKKEWKSFQQEKFPPRTYDNSATSTRKNTFAKDQASSTKNITVAKQPTPSGSTTHPSKKTSGTASRQSTPKNTVVRGKPPSAKKVATAKSKVPRSSTKSRVQEVARNSCLISQSEESSQDSDGELRTTTRRRRKSQKKLETDSERESDSGDVGVHHDNLKYDLRVRTPVRKEEKYLLRRRGGIAEPDFTNSKNETSKNAAGDFSTEEEDMEIESRSNRSRMTPRNGTPARNYQRKRNDTALEKRRRTTSRGDSPTRSDQPTLGKSKKTKLKPALEVASDQPDNHDNGKVYEKTYPVRNRQKSNGKLDSVVDTMEVTPMSGRRKRKLYSSSSNTLLDEETPGDEVCTPTTRTKGADEQLSPKEIHELLNKETQSMVLLSGGKKKSLDNYQRQSIERDGVRRESIVNYTNERIVTSREATMQEHIKVIEHKKIGEKGIQDFTYGAFTAFTHIDDLDVPNVPIYDFIVNKNGCRVKLATPL